MISPFSTVWDVTSTHAPSPPPAHCQPQSYNTQLPHIYMVVGWIPTIPMSGVRLQNSPGSSFLFYFKPTPLRQGEGNDAFAPIS